MASIIMFASGFAPRQYAYCAGQTLSISANSALFALLGTTFGGNGVQTFQLPNFQSRVPVGAGQGLGLSIYELGELGGTETTTILTSNLAPHTHTATGVYQATSTVHAQAAVPVSSLVSTPADNFLSNAAVAGSTPALVNAFSAPGLGTAVNMANGVVTTTVTGAVTNSIAGSGIPMNNLQPYIGINFIICTSGVFPSRN